MGEDCAGYEQNGCQSTWNLYLHIFGHDFVLWCLMI